MRGVHMTRSIQIRSRLVNRGMDYEASRVDFMLCRHHGFAFLVDENEVTCFYECKVHGVWIYLSINI